MLLLYRTRTRGVPLRCGYTQDYGPYLGLSGTPPSPAITSIRPGVVGTPVLIVQSDIHVVRLPRTNPRVGKGPESPPKSSRHVTLRRGRREHQVFRSDPNTTSPGAHLKPASTANIRPRTLLEEGLLCLSPRTCL
jgi:hypothetical protein